jgi:hypothetical protein
MFCLGVSEFVAFSSMAVSRNSVWYDFIDSIVVIMSWRSDIF